ncbi:hypothetical protein DUNSADRAFT_5429 [Dunaliella salina]|uniref:Uncharacterized protein n=1 Tax=Dunaliella salina TaxID=3046 RepID=A0ABQ7FUA8_DUNSA|nr:hypothetical protein DUNSADRAFT_5429 [Dunaliella salina]|eukprot:KAF5826003.1 hypothetical protein DUNSADRAFT_5429 [Dunaliella salina]
MKGRKSHIVFHRTAPYHIAFHRFERALEVPPCRFKVHRVDRIRRKSQSLTARLLVDQAVQKLKIECLFHSTMQGTCLRPPLCALSFCSANCSNLMCRNPSCAPRQFQETCGCDVATGDHRLCGSGASKVSPQPRCQAGGAQLVDMRPQLPGSGPRRRLPVPLFWELEAHAVLL